MTRKTGILGGMGPAATILLQQRILDATVAGMDQDHQRLLIDMNPQVPSRIDYLIKETGPNPGPVLARMAWKLEQNGVDAIAMPCCTAHHFAPEIEAKISQPFINMVDLTAKHVAQMVAPNSWIGILASPATEKIGLFKKALEPHGLIPLYPQNTDKILAAIESIKAHGPSTNSVGIVQDAILDLVNEGVDAFIVGCTEFSLIANQLSSAVPIIDAIDVLTAEIVKLHQASKPCTTMSRAAS